MKRRKIDSGLERQFLIGLITNKPFLSVAAGLIDTNLFPSKYVQTVAGWAIDYWKKSSEPAGKEIQISYHAWVHEQEPEESEVDAVHDFLESISQEYDAGKGTNAQFLIAELSKYLTARKVKELTTRLEAMPVEDAVLAISSFKEIKSEAGIGYNPDENNDSIRRSFADSVDPVIDMPGDAGRFFDPILTRDSLVGVQGPEKRGKTGWLFEFLYWTIRSGRRAAFFEVGDLSDAQLNKRYRMLQCQTPLWENQCKGVNWPTGLKLVKDAEGRYQPELTTNVRTFKEPLNEQIAMRGRERFVRTHKLHPTKAHVMFSVHPSMTINVRGIHGILEYWKNTTGFIPDVILIDYADILSPENSKQIDNRERENERWSALRRLAHDWHSCVIVPTQANADSYKAKTQNMGHFSNDKRKNAHVAGMLGLNQTPEEKKINIMRLNWLHLRESDYNSDQCLYVASCPALGRRMVKAVMG
jgi:hypothetical protein